MSEVHEIIFKYNLFEHCKLIHFFYIYFLIYDTYCTYHLVVVAHSTVLICVTIFTFNILMYANI